MKKSPLKLNSTYFIKFRADAGDHVAYDYGYGKGFGPDFRDVNGYRFNFRITFQLYICTYSL